MPSDLNHKRILLLGGRTHEIIDGVRYYNNQSRPLQHAPIMLNQLKKAGARVTFLAPDSKDNTDHFLKHVVKAGNDFDIILSLTSFSSIKAVTPSEEKLKLKNNDSPITLDICGTTDITSYLRHHFPDVILAGYSNWQEWFTTELSHLTHILHQLSREALEASQHHIPETYHLVTTNNGTLSGKHIIVTSGPTIEKINHTGDVISNLSSGKQGVAIAEALALMGAHITLITGPVHIPLPHDDRITIRHVTSAQQMMDATMNMLPADAYIGVAAIADFTVSAPLAEPVTAGKTITLHMERNPDILKTMGTQTENRPHIVIGFAAETNDLLNYARDKCTSKNADAICANQVKTAYGGHNNEIIWVTKTTEEYWDNMDKKEAGHHIGQHIARLLDDKSLAS